MKTVLPLTGFLLASAYIQAEEIRMGVKPGLKFDIPAFHVRPGAELTLTFSNNDEMMHNIVFTQPGKKMLVVEAAIALGAEGLANHFVPDDPAVLAASPIVQPGDEYGLKFKAPSEPGEYPYVCTFPGHGFIMHGIMFVAKKRPAKVDELLKKAQTVETETQTARPLAKAKLMRTFMPGSSPAAIAVALPGGHSYCWDAGNSRLRYVWRGGFIKRNGSYGRWRTLPTIDGHIYYREPAQPFQFTGKGETPQIQFKGYRIIDGIPEFRYNLGKVDVKEFITKLPGKSGILRRFSLEGLSCGLEFHKDMLAGVVISSDKGKWEGNILQLTKEEASSFTLEMTEIPGKAPAGYWSMDDLTKGYSKGSLVEGHSGRAWCFTSSPKVPSNLDFSIFQNSFALSFWLKVGKGSPNIQSICGWGAPDRGLVLSYEGQGAGLQIDPPGKTSFNYHGQLEAEDANVKGAAITNNNAGHSGSGYVDFHAKSGESIEWTTQVEESGEYILRFRYAVAGGNRPLDVSLNGTNLLEKAPFNDSGHWENWVDLDIPAVLKKGKHTVRLSSIGASGPNVDSLSLVSKKDLETKAPLKASSSPKPAPQQLKKDTWHHVVVNYDGQEARFYVDGKSVGTPQPVDPSLYSPSASFYIGTTQNGSPFCMDELRLYSRAITLEEIHELMKR